MMREMDAENQTYVLTSISIHQGDLSREDMRVFVVIQLHLYESGSCRNSKIPWIACNPCVMLEVSFLVARP